MGGEPIKEVVERQTVGAGRVGEGVEASHRAADARHAEGEERLGGLRTLGEEGRDGGGGARESESGGFLVRHAAQVRGAPR